MNNRLGWMPILGLVTSLSLAADNSPWSNETPTSSLQPAVHPSPKKPVVNHPHCKNCKAAADKKWYAGVNLGLGTFGSVDTSSVWYVVNAAFTITQVDYIESRDPFRLSAEALVGLKLTPAWGLELSLSTYSFKLISQEYNLTVSGTNADQFPLRSYETFAKAQSRAAFINGYLDVAGLMGHPRMWHPYLGAGLGVARYTLGVSYAFNAGTGTPGEGSETDVTTVAKGHHFGPMYKAFAGFSRRYGERGEMRFEYARLIGGYYQPGDSFASSPRLGGNTGTFINPVQIRFNSNQFKIGFVGYF